MIKINYKTKTLDIHGVGCWTERSPYDIRFDRIDTPKKLQDWVEHLKEKNWYTPDFAQELKNAYRRLVKP